MSILAQLVIAGLIFIAGTATGIKWHAGQDAIAAQAADEARESDARQQRRFNDQAAGNHARALAILNTQLGDARAQIANLSGRPCLAAGTVSVLNAIGADDMRAVAGQPAGAASAPAGPADERTATDADVATAIATCRARYAEVSSQLNQILDIEARRHPPAPP